MIFSATLILALLCFAVGMGLAVSRWLWVDPATPPCVAHNPGYRFLGATKSMVRAAFTRAPGLAKTFVLDVLLQVRSFKQSPYRWVMHQCIWLGFMLLLVFHAMDSVVSERLFGDYFSTLNPYFALRDVLGLMVLLGVVMATVRRLRARQPRLKSSGRDWTALVLLAVIIVSGFLLAGMKIDSKRAFDRMVEEYAVLDEAEARDLESFWVKEYGLAASPLRGPFDAAVLEAGAENNEMYCMGCHARPQSAPASWAVSRVLSPVAGPLDRAGFASFLWYLHFLSVFAGLAYLPFGKFLHIFATPAYLLARTALAGRPDESNEATMRALALDACMHCGTCSAICSVGAAYAVIGNEVILPSEKIALLKRLAGGGPPLNGDRRAAIQGMVLCTNCNRCGDACPAGIDLQSLWAMTRERLLADPDTDPADPISLSPLSFYRAESATELGPEAFAAPQDRAWNAIAKRFPTDGTLDLSKRDLDMSQRVRASCQSFSLASCFSCKACSSSCPVKNQYEDPQAELGLVPHQIIHATLLGQSDLVFGAKMLWACLGCYQCQEHCPQGVAVTDVLYELKNLSMARSAGNGNGESDHA